MSVRGCRLWPVLAGLLRPRRPRF